MDRIRQVLTSLPGATVCSLIGLACVFLAGGMARAEEAAAKITYDEHILPIFRDKCGACHNSNDKKGDLVLDNFAAAMRGGASGEVIRNDGDAENSQLYRTMAHLSEPYMPPSGEKLPDEQLALVRKWIEGGALQNSGSVARVKKPMLVAKVDVSTERPAGPPPMPENLPLEPLVTSSRGNGVTALAVNPWSSLAAVSAHKQVLLYETKSRDLVGVLPFPEGQPHILKFSRNGQLLLVGGGRGGHSGKVVLFEVQTGRRMAEIGDEYDIVCAADLSADQSLVALGGPKKIVRVYNVATGALEYEVKKHTDWITAIEFSPDGVLLATGDRSNGLFVWEAANGREFYVLQGHSGTITDVSWSPDSNLLASSSEDTTVRLWEMQGGAQVKSWAAHGGGVQAVDFTRTSQLVTTGRDNHARRFDLNGAEQKLFVGMTDVGMEVAYDAEADLALAGGLAGTVYVWNSADGVLQGTIATNPPPLASQLQAALTSHTEVEAQLAQARQGLAGLEQAMQQRLQAVEAAKAEAMQRDAQLVAANQALEAATGVKNTAATVLETAIRAHQATTEAVSAAASLPEDQQAAAKKALEATQAAAESAALGFQKAEQELATATAAQQAAAKLVSEAPALVAAAEEQAKLTPEQEQQLAGARQAVQGAEARLNVSTTRVARLQAAAQQPPAQTQSTEAPGAAPATAGGGWHAAAAKR